MVGGPDEILNELNAVLCRHLDYQILLGLTPPAESDTPAVDTHPVSHQADGDLNDLDEAALDDEGEAKLSLDWLRKAVAQEKVEKEDVPPLEITVAPTVEKKDLTLEERKKVKPSGEFLMDLTKAMLRSGYYSADHPGSEGAKQGLYENVQSKPRTPDFGYFLVLLSEVRNNVHLFRIETIHVFVCLKHVSMSLSYDLLIYLMYSRTAELMELI